MTSNVDRYVGLINQGCTCYLNTWIQALFHLPKFRYFVLGLETSPKDVIPHALKRLFAQLEAGIPNITTVELTRAFGWGEGDAVVQHDVHEMAQQLFDTLETYLKGTPHEHFIRDMFGGLIVYRSTATDGVKYVSDRLEQFYDVEVVVKNKNNIRESFDAFSQPEQIEGVSIEVEPGKPPSKHNIQRTQHFVDLPPVLLIHPNRVAFDMETYELVTLSNHWSFDEKLDLSEYMIDKKTFKLDKESLELLKKTEKSLIYKRGDIGAEYELRSILTHAGTATLGHYYIYVRLGDEWVLFEDDLVDVADEEKVKKSAFGGQSAQSKYRLFENERASMLVFVNVNCAKEILHETPPDKNIIKLAKEVEEKQNEERDTTKYSYLVCDDHLVDCLDLVPHALQKYTRSIRASRSLSVEQFTELVARDLNVNKAAVRVLPSNRSERYPIYYFSFYHELHLIDVNPERTATQSGSTRSDDANPFFLVVRQIDAMALGRPKFIRSVKDFTVPNGYTVYICNALSDRAAIVPVTNGFTLQELNGCNIIISPPGFNAVSVEKLYRSRQYEEAVFYYLNELNQPVKSVKYKLLNEGSITYTELQAKIYGYLKQNTKLELPPSREYILFYSSQDESGETPKKDPTWPYVGTHYKQEATLDYLCAHGRTVFFRFLQMPLPEVESGVRLLFNIGWEVQPLIFCTKNATVMTFKQIIDWAYAQVGKSLSPNLRKLYNDNRETPANVFRILFVQRGEIVRICTDPKERINLAVHNLFESWVIDICREAPASHKAVDVLYCNRRSGEQYFGLPISIVLSKDLTEKGEDIIGRVSKRLAIPAEVAATVTKKWMVSVKDKKTHKIQSLGRGDVLASAAKEINSADFYLLIDRPQRMELDQYVEYRKQDDAIVIRSTSKEDLASM
ncbi:ubiquitin carboxyl-terminal hydrolase 7 [Angomonas deanei]|nr:ubiquitin carboxyl-terminal hydrolase 7 [Angomonas deanei]|eukprot:EPY32025.1 ubiquitin carboxyl-terminal hydrolase 7 [Angomonas deanei]